MHHAEPFRVKVVQHNKPVPAHRRTEALKEAGFNVYRLRRSDVTLDLAASEGAEAMSDRQWAALMVGDEAYAGSRNFYHLEESVREILGKRFVVPTHQGRGSEHLLFRHLVKPGQTVLTNRHVLTAGPIGEDSGARFEDLTVSAAFAPESNVRFKGDVDLDRLRDALADPGRDVAIVLLTAAVPLLGGQVLSPECLEQASALCKRAGVPLVLDASQIASAAWLAKTWTGDDAALGEVVRRYCAAADVVSMGARADAFCHTGGLIAMDDEETLRDLQALVVVYEGLHTYGGQAGRDMEAFACGLKEMIDPGYQTFRRRKLDFIERGLREAGLPLYEPVGTNGVCIDARALAGGAAAEDFCSEALAASLYLSSGVRVGPYGRLRQPDEKIDLLSLYVARRTYTERQIDYVIDSCAALNVALKSVKVAPFRLAEGSPSRHELAELVPGDELPVPTRPSRPEKPRPEPYIIKVVEPLVVPDRERRQAAVKEAGYNTFLLRSDDVYIDLLTDSGTSAMSSEQWAAMFATHESETGTCGFDNLVEAVRDILGYRFALPTHQGRAAEHLLSRCAIKPGQIVVNNMYFTTTREHQEMAGGVFKDLIVAPAHDPTSEHPFKGDIDVDRLEALIAEVGPDAIAYICLESNVNMAGGQPVSMAGARRLSAVARYHGIPVFWDATRIAENAYFIKWKEPGYQDHSIHSILRELASYGDGCTISCKKDLLVNIGGLLCVNDPDLYERVAALGGVYEGAPTQGGLASRDLTAMAVGLREMADFDYLHNRVQQVQYLANGLRTNGVPIVEPPGGHAVFLDARRFLDHLPQDLFPAQRLASELYVESGVRAMERGIVSSGRDPETGENKRPALELVRLTIPRRVYTYSHMDVVADGVAALYQRRHELKGLRFTYEPKRLRFFQARFEDA